MSADRITLAEAMGWTEGEILNGTPVAFPEAAQNAKWEVDHRKAEVPDPFTDANDDYAVLEWAIKNLDPDAYFAALSEVVGSYCYMHEYRIGYFASAALKVIAAAEQEPER